MYTSLTYFVRYQDYPTTFDFMRVVESAYRMKTYPIDKFAIPKEMGVMSELEFHGIGVQIVFKPRPLKVDFTAPQGITMSFGYHEYKNSCDFGRKVISMTSNSPVFMIYFPHSRYEYLNFSYLFSKTKLDVQIAERLPL